MAGESEHDAGHTPVKERGKKGWQAHVHTQTQCVEKEMPHLGEKSSQVILQRSLTLALSHAVLPTAYEVGTVIILI